MSGTARISSADLARLRRELKPLVGTQFALLSIPILALELRGVPKLLVGALNTESVLNEVVLTRDCRDKILD